MTRGDDTMERPHATPEQQATVAAKLDALRIDAGEKFGYDAQFAYQKQGSIYILSFDEAIQICGHFIAQEEPEAVMEKLDEFHTLFTHVINNPHSELLLQRGRANGQQKLAEYAITSE